MLALADTFDEEHIEGRLTLLRRALGNDQPGEVRESALGILVTVPDRRAIPLWQMLLSDDDELTREMAKDQIELLRDLDSEK
jgi:HEAT repeat protein